MYVTMHVRLLGVCATAYTQFTGMCPKFSNIHQEHYFLDILADKGDHALYLDFPAAAVKVEQLPSRAGSESLHHAQCALRASVY